MASARNSIDSNSSGLSIAEETEPKVLPGTPVWRERAILNPGDTGAEITNNPTEEISRNRQIQRGTPTDQDVVAAHDIYMSNDYLEDLQGFLFADAREQISTKYINGSAGIVVTAVQASGAYKATTGLSVFNVGALVLATGFGLAANNGLGLVSAATGPTLTTNIATVAEASPPAEAHVRTVGFEFPTGDLALTVSGGLATLTSTGSNWANVDLNVGQWIFVGGDATDTAYASGYGYGRVRSITDAAVTLDDVAWVGGAIGADTGTGKKVRVFISTFIRNEDDPALIKCRTYQIERTLGEDNDGTQSDYETGCVANELSLNIPLTDRHTAGLSYIGLGNETRTGLEGLKSGTRIAKPKAKPYNTSSDVFRMRIAILDDTTLAPTSLFAYLSDVSFSINNNAKALKAIGVFGGFDISVGSFVASGSETAYFTTVESIRAVQDNKDVGTNTILARNNEAIVYDLPYHGVAGGRLGLQKDDPITIPVTANGAENALGYTFSVAGFSYVPNIAMPVQ